MGYKVIADRFETDAMRQKYGPRKGLEGPFMYASGRVLYYDPREGRYWDSPHRLLCFERRDGG